MGRHVIAVAGSRVVVQDGRIVSISEPVIRSCPLRSKVYGVKTETAESVRETVEYLIREWGMFTPRRIVRSNECPVSFGVSEILSSGLRHGVLDAVVSVCEGAGTVISADPAVVQGIGAHMTGLIETSPEPAIIQRLLEAGAQILSADDARIDQVSGAALALQVGHGRIGVTISGLLAREASEIRDLCLRKTCALASVHNSGMTRGNAETVASSCDIVTACASKWAREIVGPLAIMQLGLHIPVFILTPLGKELALARLRDFDGPLLVGSGSIPKLDREQPDPLF
jgi:putative methanogenesis marker protein 8